MNIPLCHIGILQNHYKFQCLEIFLYHQLYLLVVKHHFQNFLDPIFVDLGRLLDGVEFFVIHSRFQRCLDARHIFFPSGRGKVRKGLIDVVVGRLQDSFLQVRDRLFAAEFRQKFLVRIRWVTEALFILPTCHDSVLDRRIHHRRLQFQLDST